MSRTAHLFYEPADLDVNTEQRFVDAIEQFPQFLEQSPVELHIHVARFPDKIREQVLAVLNQPGPIEDRNASLFNWFCDNLGYAPRLIVGCHSDHGLAHAALENNPDALWGGALGPLALTYRPENRHLVWHEALHLFGAKDCYALPDEGPTCEHSGCIMQYAPDVNTVSAWPWLCRCNVARIRKWVAEFDKSLS